METLPFILEKVYVYPIRESLEKFCFANLEASLPRLRKHSTLIDKRTAERAVFFINKHCSRRCVNQTLGRMEGREFTGYKRLLRVYNFSLAYAVE